MFYFAHPEFDGIKDFIEQEQIKDKAILQNVFWMSIWWNKALQKEHIPCSVFTLPDSNTFDLKWWICFVWFKFSLDSSCMLWFNLKKQIN